MSGSFFRAFLIGLCAVALAAPVATLQAHSAHEHGKAEIRLAMDGNKMVLVLQTPQDSIIGFERAPKGESELAKAKAAVEILKAGSKLFEINAEASCVFKETSLVAPNLVVSASDAGKVKDHSDVEVSYNLDCANPNKLSSVVVNVFDAFKSVKVIHVQFVGNKKQKSVRLTSSARSVKL
jgi:Protein of unknown function (DUF2796)